MKKEKSIKFPVAMARGNHLYPYRTQKLSIITATIVLRCDNSKLPVLFLFWDHIFFIIYRYLLRYLFCLAKKTKKDKKRQKKLYKGKGIW